MEIANVVKEYTIVIDESIVEENRNYWGELEFDIVVDPTNDMGHIEMEDSECTNDGENTFYCPWMIKVSVDPDFRKGDMLEIEYTSTTGSFSMRAIVRDRIFVIAKHLCRFRIHLEKGWSAKYVDDNGTIHTHNWTD